MSETITSVQQPTFGSAHGAPEDKDSCAKLASPTVPRLWSLLMDGGSKTGKSTDDDDPWFTNPCGGSHSKSSKAKREAKKIIFQSDEDIGTAAIRETVVFCQRTCLALPLKQKQKQSPSTEAGQVEESIGTVDIRAVMRLIRFTSVFLDRIATQEKRIGCDQQQKEEKQRTRSSGSDLSKMTIDLITRITRRVSAQLQKCQKQQQGQTQTVQDGYLSVALFLVKELVYQIDKPLISGSGRAFLLVPTFRGIADVVSSLRSCSGSSNPVITISMANEITERLVVYLNQGRMALRDTIRSSLASGMREKMQQHHIKVMIFIILRISSLISSFRYFRVVVPPRREELVCSFVVEVQGRQVEVNDGVSMCVLKKVILALVNLRGLGMRCQILSELSKLSVVRTGHQDVTQGDTGKVKKAHDNAFAQFCTKVDSCAEKLYSIRLSFPPWVENKENHRTQPSGKVVHLPILCRLLDYSTDGPTNRGELDDSDLKNSTDDHGKEDNFSERSLGTLAFLQRFLPRLWDENHHVRVATNSNTIASPIIVPSHIDRNACSELNEVNSCIIERACETILRWILPSGHEMLLAHKSGFCASPTATSTISAAVELLVDCLVYLVLPGDQGLDTFSDKRTRHVHGLLAKWACPVHIHKVRPSRSSGLRMHPLSREVLLCTISHYIAVLWQGQAGHTGRVAVTHLVFLLSTLAFDDRTSHGHRQILVAALRRIVAFETDGSAVNSKGQDVPGKLKGLMCQCIWDAFGSSLRKGNDGTWANLFTCSSSHIVEPLLECFSPTLIWSHEELAMELRGFCANVASAGNDVEALRQVFSGQPCPGRDICDRLPKPLPVTVALGLLGATLSGIYKLASTDRKYNGETNAGSGGAVCFRVKSTFLQVSGVELLCFADSVLYFLIGHTSGENEDGRGADSRSADIELACLRFLRGVVTFVGLCISSTQHSLLLKYFAATVDRIKVAMMRRIVCHDLAMSSLGLAAQSVQHQSFIVMEIVLSLYAVGKATDPDCPRQSLMTIASVFNSLLTSAQWQIVGGTISALEAFASMVPANHQWILHKCLPAERQAYLQSRLTGDLFNIDAGRGVTAQEAKEMMSMPQFEANELLKLRNVVEESQCSHSFGGAFNLRPESRVYTIHSGNDKVPALLILPPNRGWALELEHAFLDAAGRFHGLETCQQKSLQRLIREQDGFRLKFSDGNQLVNEKE